MLACDQITNNVYDQYIRLFLQKVLIQLKVDPYFFIFLKCNLDRIKITTERKFSKFYLKKQTVQNCV